VSYGCCISLYLVRQLGMPVDGFVLWRVSKTIRYSMLALDLRDLVNLLIKRIDRLRSVEQLDCSLFLLCMQWSSGQSIEPAPMLFALYIYISLLFLHLLSIVSLSRLASSVDWSASIGLINIMLVGHLTLISYINY